MSAPSEVVIVGGGIIGLSLAYELSGRGVSVTLLEKGEVGRESSWAGAGILTPASLGGAREPLDLLRAHSLERLGTWSVALREETGIDNGYRRCGGLRIALEEADIAGLEEEMRSLEEQGVTVEPLDARDLARLEPELTRRLARAYRTPTEAQLRNPWHLRALAVACGIRGVRLETDRGVTGLVREGSRIVAAETVAGKVPGEAFVVTAGAWSPALLGTSGLRLPGRPVRGQIVLLTCRVPALRHILWAGSRYLVPRPEGRVLVGSTEEDAGFDAHPTAGGALQLLQLALRLSPGLGEARLDKAWAGLRPATADGMPALGRAPGYDNLFIATGHFRAGVELSAGTALLLAQLLLGEPTTFPLDPFDPDRFSL